MDGQWVKRDDVSEVASSPRNAARRGTGAIQPKAIQADVDTSFQTRRLSTPRTKKNSAERRTTVSHWVAERPSRLPKTMVERNCGEAEPMPHSNAANSHQPTVGRHRIAASGSDMDNNSVRSGPRTKDSKFSKRTKRHSRDHHRETADLVLMPAIFLVVGRSAT